MMVIEPVGVQQRPRYPGQIILPILIPPSPEGADRPLPERKSSLWFWALAVGIVGLVYSAEKSPSSMGSAPLPKKAPTDRLYWMWVAPGKWYQDAKSIPKTKLLDYKQRAITTSGSLYALYAESADAARHKLRVDPPSRHSYTRAVAEGERAITRKLAKAEERRQAEKKARGPRLPLRKSRKIVPEEGAQLTLFSGRIANCAVWIEDGKHGWKCGAYGRVCDSPTCAPPPDPTVKQTKVCVRTQKVFSAFYNKLIKRCKQYEATCEGPACMPMTMPFPTEEPERTTPTDEEVKSYAEWMADQYNEEQFERIPYLAREILDRGGIAPHKTPYGLEPPKRSAEEYTAIPLFLRNREGMPLDEIAAEMGFDYEEDLRAEILKAYPQKTKGEWKKHTTRKTWRDFQEEARWEVREKMQAGEWFGFAGLAGSLGVRYQKGDINSAINAAIKTTGDRPLYIFPTYYGYEIKRSVPSWLSHYKVHPDGRVEEHTRDVRTGKWTVERLRSTRAQEPEQLRLLGQDLFPGLRRELKLEPAQDPATSDDPVVACMERLGWSILRMDELKASISEKLTPDLFTGKIKRLSPGEKDYQRVMGQCLAASSGIAGFELLGRRLQYG